MTCVHFVYPHGESISCPDAIGRKLAERLHKRYEVVQHEWNAGYSISPGPNDVLLGHPHPARNTVFRRSLRNSGWKRVVAMIPYSHGDLGLMAWADRIMSRCDLFLAITGDYWFSLASTSEFSHWVPKMVHLDLAVDVSDYPSIKHEFNPPGYRKFLYVGSRIRCKNTGYLSSIAQSDHSIQVSWMGSGRRPIRGLERLGFVDFRTDEAKKIVAEHDFLITVGRSDANPATILEAMSWGLIPVCTPQSGYSRHAGIINIPLGNRAKAVEIIQKLQEAEGSQLKKLQSMNREAIQQHFNWDRFSAQVCEAIDSPLSPSLGSESLARRAKLTVAELTSPHVRNKPRDLLRKIWKSRDTVPGGTYS